MTIVGDERSGDLADAHARSAGEVAAALGVDLDVGLSQAAAAARLATSGRNELEAPRRTSVWEALWDSITEPFILLLAAAGLGAVFLGEVRDGLFLLAGLIPIVAADVITEYRSERALEALQEASAPRAHVLRSGRNEEIAAAEVVPGDVLMLRAGDVVAADARVATASALVVDRSVLTGESVPEAATPATDAATAALLDRHGMVYAGTSVVGGRGQAVVVATGPRTELGSIAARLGRADRSRSPLQRELDRLVRILLVAAISLIVITVGLGFLRGQPAGANLLAGISAAIAAIPEEPPVLLAVVLGLGAYRLLRRGVLVRRLNAQETLGAVDLIITDKTGTLTRNQLELQAVLTPGGPLEGEDRRRVLLDALATQEDAWSGVARRGTFTRAIDAELGTTGAPLDHAELQSVAGPADGRPYSSCLLAPSTGREATELALGAPEVVLAFASALSPLERGAWEELLHAQAGRGGRLLLLAERRGEAPWRPRGLLCFADALRDEVPEAMVMATAAGIQTMVVTGDHPTTAAAIAAAAGLPPGEEIIGPRLAELDDDEVARLLPDLRIVARALPEQKLRLVRLARRAHRTVAVTGDGVNDAPALNNADVAVAMGSGTAVAREASDLVLGDDSFATLMNALREGRRIVANVQKGLVFVVSTHVALLGFILIATIAGFGQPLLPLQILWMELFIDISTSVAFEREPEEPDAMSRPPRPRDQPLLSVPILGGIGLAGGFTAFAALFVVLLGDGDFDRMRWVAYTALVIGQAVRAYANRSIAEPIHWLGSNWLLAGACLFAIAVQIALPFIPGVADAFHAHRLDLGEWAIVVVIALAPALLAQVIRTWRPGHTWIA
ncbi:MAG TPA: cation-transporting P-type ATPase [Candidatus Limnocylindria bacterium]|nr:cation-transporting P-type ATPase [Candidatus Limnocylindria bacterium]